MKNSALFHVAFFAFIIYFSGCKKDDCIIGNSELKLKTRDVGDFNKINANGDFNISYSQPNMPT